MSSTFSTCLGAPEGSILATIIIALTDATKLECSLNSLLETIPLSAHPQVSLIAPLGDSAHLYVLVTYTTLNTSGNEVIPRPDE